MKKYILCIILFSTTLLANESSLTLKSYSSAKEIDISNISQYTSKFKTQKEQKKDNEPNITISLECFFSVDQNASEDINWIMIELDENLSSGNYLIEHTIFDFIQHSFSSQQSLEKFSIFGKKVFSFHYTKGKDKTRYFLKTVKQQSGDVLIANLYTFETFSNWTNKYALKLLLSFFLFGFILMTAIYNGALYIYNREKSFLYYMIMQIFMVLVLFYQTDIIATFVMTHMETLKIVLFIYFFFAISSTLFALLFIRSFFETKRYLPLHDKILYYITLLVIVDLVFFFAPIIMMMHLYSIMTLYFLYIAWLRLKQGYKPALFFIIGWVALMLGLFFKEYITYDLFLDPMLIGSVIEAILLSIALSYKINQIKKEKDEQKELLIHQSRLASMGEMLANIAHQWRQPLSRLGYILMNIENRDKNSLHSKKLQEASTQLEFMSQTIDDFRNFFAPDKEKESFNLAKETQNVLSLIDFKEIEIELKINKEIEILNYKNEYKQVILNLLSNAKDILLERKISSAKILIEIDSSVVKISDNGGGIKTQKIQKIFEPYFSTKENGLGIGLYMSKIIIEKNMQGTIDVKNSNKGAIFSLNFSKLGSIS